MHNDDPRFPDLIAALAPGDRVTARFAPGSFRLSGATVTARLTGPAGYTDDDALYLCGEFLRYSDDKPGLLVDEVTDVNGLTPEGFIARRQAEARSHENGSTAPLVVDVDWLLGDGPDVDFDRKLDWLETTVEVLGTTGTHPTARGVLERLTEALRAHRGGE